MASETTVLVVDDDQANLESVARIFQKMGLRTLSAPGGRAAVELLRRPEVSVMVTDLMMPGVDGQELLRTARALRPDVEVVLMTAFGTVETAVDAMREGAYDFITKPLKRQSLGVWVVLFLALLAFLAYLLKNEYWTDVH